MIIFKVRTTRKKFGKPLAPLFHYQIHCTSSQLLLSLYCLIDIHKSKQRYKCSTLLFISMYWIIYLEICLDNWKCNTFKQCPPALKGGRIETSTYDRTSSRKYKHTKKQLCIRIHILLINFTEEEKALPLFYDKHIVY